MIPIIIIQCMNAIVRTCGVIYARERKSIKRYLKHLMANKSAEYNKKIICCKPRR